MSAKSRLQTTTVTITTGTSLSSAVQINGQLVGVLMSAAWDTAGLSFQASADNSTFGNVFTNAGAELTWSSTAAAAANYVAAIPSGATALPAANFIKIRSGTSGTPVLQTTGGTDRVLTLVYLPS